MEKMDKLLETHDIEKVAKTTQSITDSLSSQGQTNDHQKQKYMISKCKYDLCDGGGVLYGLNSGGYMEGKNCKCTEDKIKESIVRFAKIPEEFVNLTVNSFRTDLYSTTEAQAIATRAREASAKFIKQYEHFEELGKGLYFYSDTKGSGKTRLAISVGNAVMNTKRKSVRYITTLDLLAEIRKTYNKDSETTEADIVDEISMVDCLILDDVGVEDGERPWIKEKMFQILDYRMTRKKITIFTSNVSVTALRYDERIKNRIERMAVPVKMPEESIRSQLSNKENEEIARMLFD